MAGLAASGRSPHFIRRATAPTRSSSSPARSRAPFVAGEPIREGQADQGQRLRLHGRDPAEGMRAISTEISPETGAGGFDPAERPCRRDPVAPRPRGREGRRRGSSFVSETVLANVAYSRSTRRSSEKDGQKVVIGKTATLELTPRQAETLALSRQLGTLSLALRSLADASDAEPSERNDDHDRDKRARHQHGRASASAHRDHAEMSLEQGTRDMASETDIGPDRDPRPLFAAPCLGRPRDRRREPADGSAGAPYTGRSARTPLALRAARRRQIGRDRPAARRQGRAGRRSEDRQCGGAFDAARLPDRRRRRADQHLLLRRRGQADRRLRHRRHARPQRRARDRCKQLLPDADMRVEGVGDGVMLSGSVANADRIAAGLRRRVTPASAATTRSSTISGARSRPGACSR